jgi:hypothetical protein
MKYMLLCYDDEKAWEKAGEPALQAAMQQAVQLSHEVNDRGQLLDVSPLEWSSSAVCVRVRDGKTTVTDGPYTETREVLGGYYIIDVDNLDEALAVAARHPGAPLGAVEVRPLVELPNMPATT